MVLLNISLHHNNSRITYSIFFPSLRQPFHSEYCGGLLFFSVKYVKKQLFPSQPKTPTTPSMLPLRALSPLFLLVSLLAGGVCICGWAMTGGTELWARKKRADIGEPPACTHTHTIIPLTFRVETRPSTLSLHPTLLLKHNTTLNVSLLLTLDLLIGAILALLPESGEICPRIQKKRYRLALGCGDLLLGKGIQLAPSHTFNFLLTLSLSALVHSLELVDLHCYVESSPSPLPSVEAASEAL